MLSCPESGGWAPGEGIHACPRDVLAATIAQTGWLGGVYLIPEVRHPTLSAAIREANQGCLYEGLDTMFGEAAFPQRPKPQDGTFEG